jgi:hypothetical protein
LHGDSLAHDLRRPSKVATVDTSTERQQRNIWISTRLIIANASIERTIADVILGAALRRHTDRYLTMAAIETTVSALPDT